MDGARAIVNAFDELWPAEDGDMAGVRARLAEARVCGDGLDALFAKNGADGFDERDREGWNERGIGIPIPGRRARSRAHAGARARAASRARADTRAGSGRFCDERRARRVPKAARRGLRRRRAGSSTSSRATTAARTSWGWPRRFRAAKSSPRATRSSGCGGRTTKSTRGWRRARGEGRGRRLGRPRAFPKAQWPAYAACEACREVAAGANEAVRWDEEAVAAFLTVYFHGVGAPRLELGDGKSGAGRGPGRRRTVRARKNGGNGGKRAAARRRLVVDCAKRSRSRRTA